MQGTVNQCKEQALDLDYILITNFCALIIIYS